MVKLVPQAEQVVQRWKNGGGTTREIAKEPAAASLDAFDWRVSRAHVEDDGPFSRFWGVDRTLLVIAGNGILLEIEGGEAVTLDRRSAPFAFSGDVPASARLVDGPIDDLNIMTRRARFRHRAERRILAPGEAVGLAPEARVLFVESGAILVGESRLTPGDALIRTESEELTVRAADGAIIAVVSVFAVNERC